MPTITIDVEKIRALEDEIMELRGILATSTGYLDYILATRRRFGEYDDINDKDLLPDPSMVITVGKIQQLHARMYSVIKDKVNNL